MAATRVIRIDDEVWAELQKRARPLEDTPNSVLRRLVGLPEEKDKDTDDMDPRVTALLQVVGELVGQIPQVSLEEHGYSVLSEAGDVVAYIRPLRERLRITSSRQIAQKAGLNDWDSALMKSGSFGAPSVRWYLPDGDAAANKRLAVVLAMLWRHDVSPEAVPVRADPAAHAKVAVLRLLA